MSKKLRRRQLICRKYLLKVLFALLQGSHRVWTKRLMFRGLGLGTSRSGVEDQGVEDEGVEDEGAGQNIIRCLLKVSFALL